MIEQSQQAPSSPQGGVPERGFLTRVAPASTHSGSGVLVLLSLALSAFVYYPILRNYFWSDDFLNLYYINNNSLAEYLLTPHGGHMLMTRNLIFYLCYQVFGTHAEGYFALVLLTHLANVFLLFQVIRLCTQSARLGCFGSALWGMAPVNEGSLGWYSVYGHVLVATIFLWILYRLLQTANGRDPGRGPWWWALGLVTASTSFGVGIAVAVTAPIVAFILLPASRTRTRIVLIFLAVAVLVPLLYNAVLSTYYRNYEGVPDLRPVIEAQMHEIPAILVSLVHMVSYGILALTLGVFVGMAGYPSLPAYVVIGIFLIAVIAAAIAAPRRVRAQLLVCLLLSISCYGIIAAGRGGLFATTWNAGLAAAPRYHYVAPLPLVIALCIVLARVDAWRSVMPWLKNVALVGWLTFAIVAMLQFGNPINNRQMGRGESRQMIEAIHRVAAETPPGQDVYIANRVFLSIGMILARMPNRFPGWAAVFSIYFPDNVVDGHRIFFVVSDPQVLEATRKGKRTREFVIASDQVDPALVHAEPPRKRAPLRPPPTPSS